MTKMQDDLPNGGMKIDIGQITSAGHVVIAGRDAAVWGGAHRSDSRGSIMIAGGVETTPEELQQLRQSLEKLERVIEAQCSDSALLAAAKRNSADLAEQLVGSEKPNEHLLVQAASALYHYGADIAGAVVAAFTTPLAGKIVACAGYTALRFYRQLRGLSPDLSDNDSGEVNQ
ncbi:MAG: hypothetical protein JNJ61_24685 [Anaerolineae bacterium]|nr:hypothetical protein [Anaerolineae bacterium]